MGERRTRTLATGTIAALALAVLGAAGEAQESRGAARRPAGAGGTHAVATRALTAHDSARLHYVSASGSTLYEVGSASGTLPGGMRVHMRLAATFTGTFVIYANGGSIIGHGLARAHGSGTYESFAGTLTVTGGTGRFSHAHGRAGLYGVFDRRNYALSVQTKGTLYY